MLIYGISAVLYSMAVFLALITGALVERKDFDAAKAGAGMVTILTLMAISLMVYALETTKVMPS